MLSYIHNIILYHIPKVGSLGCCGDDCLRGRWITDFEIAIEMGILPKTKCKVMWNKRNGDSVGSIPPKHYMKLFLFMEHGDWRTMIIHPLYINVWQIFSANVFGAVPRSIRIFMWFKTESTMKSNSTRRFLGLLAQKACHVFIHPRSLT